MSLVVAYFYADTPSEVDCLIMASGTQATVSRDSSEYWGAQISWSSLVDGEVEDIQISVDHTEEGYRPATAEEFIFLRKAAQDALDCAEVEEPECEIEY